MATIKDVSRLTVDFSPEAAEELNRIKELTGLKNSEVLRYGFALMRMYVDAESQNGELRIVMPDSDTERVIKLPLQADLAKHRRNS
ncbi:hypothetical protein [Calycomorphotria hydatis]|uniref:Ribbon-helix-helix protein CopG domain-containing protein n=1 Tax=Calycomorphotria hydatis TaxID=2528027 RepID=A0A517TDI8_9PLAN|nr:hypothetical protein [Calycomorphotria hydatis]QDT66429.1 hypothetical protein V22_36960 [Calycomorphotria hydatis]